MTVSKNLIGLQSIRVSSLALAALAAYGSFKGRQNRLFVVLRILRYLKVRDVFRKQCLSACYLYPESHEQDTS